MGCESEGWGKFAAYEWVTTKAGLGFKVWV